MEVAHKESSFTKFVEGLANQSKINSPIYTKDDMKDSDNRVQPLLLAKRTRKHDKKSLPKEMGRLSP